MSVYILGLCIIYRHTTVISIATCAKTLNMKVLGWSFLAVAAAILSSNGCLATKSHSLDGRPTPNSPVPSPDVLAWTKREIGAFYSFNMISMLTNISTQYFCLGGGWVPPSDTFNPEKLDLDNWLQAAVAFGAKYAVLTAKHCSGFSMWPTDILKETGFNYTYSTKYSSFRGGGYDVVKEFVDSCKKYGVLPGIYYSLNQNYYLNVRHGTVHNGSLVPGQEKVSQELYGKIVLAQVRELWSNYGEISELWFDGGCSVPGVSEQIAALQEELQPHAVFFQGCSKENNIRWVGTESGEPKYPIWSTSDNCATGGTGAPAGNTFCPAETDTMLQEFDHWFWRADFPIRTLEELQSVYYHSVGQNTNLLLNAAANSSGLIEETSFVRYKEFGDWIHKCFGSSIAETSGVQSSDPPLELSLPSGDPFLFNNVVVSEDQTRGEAVLEFVISAILPNQTTVDIFSGQSIGNKFILNLKTPMTATKVQIKVTLALYQPVISKFSIYYC